MPAIRITACWPAAPASASTPRSSATSRSAASGLLNRDSAARAFSRRLPEFLFLPPASYGPKIWYEERRRRPLSPRTYTFRYRSVPYPALQTFDAPNGDFSCVRRARSNTPLQALTTLNEPLFLECARALALKVLRDGGTKGRATIELRFPPLPVALADSRRRGERCWPSITKSQSGSPSNKRPRPSSRTTIQRMRSRCPPEQRGNNWRRGPQYRACC